MYRFTVSAVRPDELMAACRVLALPQSLIDREERALRFRDLLVSGQFDPAGLFVAKDEASVVLGAILVQPLSGALGLAGPPRAEPMTQHAAVEDFLVSAACDWLRCRGVKVCQSFGDGAERADFAAIERHGFRRVTQLADMKRRISRDRTGERMSLELRPFAADPDAFTAALLLSYDGSLDCPELTGDRTPAEMVNGFRGNGLVGQAWWFTVLKGGQPIGVVMWDPGTELGVLEVSYLGLVPSARGRGLGAELVRRTIDFAHDSGFHTLSLSVDARNQPAIRLYQRRGFVEHNRRDVYLVSWPRPG